MVADELDVSPMPIAPPRACARCGCLPPCACARQREQRRGTRTARGYSNSWLRYSQDFRSRFPFCGQRADGRFSAEHSRCYREGRKILGDCVDHIVPLRDGGSVFDPSNHQTLCFRCNTAKG